jgi:hypothetical protein
MIELSESEWNDLVKQVLVFALRQTHTRNVSRQPTQRDRAREAVQRACERCVRVRPAHIQTVDALRTYLFWAVRSELAHASEEGAARRGGESLAAAEAQTLGKASSPSAEVLNLEAGTADRGRKRAALAVERLREELEAAGDAIALGTVECIAKDNTEPSEQARILGCSVQQIYDARKRRKRALEKILADVDAGADDEKEKS